MPENRWPVRVWPAVAIVAAMLFLFIVPAIAFPRTSLHFLSFIAAPVLSPIFMIVWWIAFARVHGRIKWIIPVVVFVPVVLISIVDILGGGQPMAAIIFGLPLILIVWVAWLLVSFALPRNPRQWILVNLLAVVWFGFGLLRLDGTDADMVPEFSFRFLPKPEDRDTDELNARPTVTPTVPLASRSDDWAEFRGPNRDGTVTTGTKIDPDWDSHPPKELWKQKIGPGWGTFAVVGDRLFTQEQRGKQEAVVCYDAAKGGEIWRYYENALFKEEISGAGPRATPTISAGKLYAMGATGWLICLNAEDGKEIWKTDIKIDTGGVPPQWGYSSSPLVSDGVVIVYAGGPDGKGTAGFDAGTGKLAWASGSATHGYSSAQRATVLGSEQVLLLSDYGLEAFEAKTGKKIWEHEWFVKGMNRATQPTDLGNNEFLIGTGVGNEMGTRKLLVGGGTLGWQVTEVWRTGKVRPYFNDGCVFENFFYGFDDKKLVCVDLKDGAIKWDIGTKFGHGQIVLLKEQGLIIVQAVDGKVHLLKATPQEPTELGKFTAVPGKTWNHPVVHKNRLYVRNGQWAAAYDLSGK